MSVAGDRPVKASDEWRAAMRVAAVLAPAELDALLTATIDGRTLAQALDEGAELRTEVERLTLLATDRGEQLKKCAGKLADAAAERDVALRVVSYFVDGRLSISFVRLIQFNDHEDTAAWLRFKATDPEAAALLARLADPT